MRTGDIGFVLSSHRGFHRLVSPFQISLNTRDIFIECTATDLTKAKVVLNTVCCMFAEYCENPFEVEPVQVIDAFGKAQSGWGHTEKLSKHWQSEPLFQLINRQRSI